MTATAVFTWRDCLLHNPGIGHPESPARLRILLEALESCPRASVQEISEPASVEILETVHGPEYLRMLERLSARGGGVLDPDTVADRHSWSAAAGGAAAAVAALEYSLATGLPAFVAVRPPGHHALATRAMGFCLIANAALTARLAKSRGIAHTLIVDWDVHHGNGTQSLVEADPAIRFVSMHQSPWWPGSGGSNERGCGNIFNLPMPPGLPPEVYTDELWKIIKIAAFDFQPELIIVSAGFDCLKGDPLGGFTLEPRHLAEVTTRLRDLAPGALMVSLLEGGYSPPRLAQGVIAHINALSGMPGDERFP